MLRSCTAVLAVCTLLALPGAAQARRNMPDSTVADAWQLPNGLRVVTRDVPGASSIAITIAVPVGRDADPPDQPGMSRLAAEVQMMAAAGDVPSRLRGEMESLRPLGWSIKVGPRATQLAEVATREQFPGVLRQVAARLAGVTVDDAVLREARATVRRDLGQELFGDPGQALYFQVREYGLGADPRGLLDRAAARELDRVRPAELQARLRSVWVPAEAVLAIAGDLQDFDVRALVAQQFGSLPAGTPPPPAPARPLRPSQHALARPGLVRPLGVVGVLAPALTDTLHPQFFLSLLIMGEHFGRSWPAGAGVARRFSYSILDEPDLVRVFPEVPADSLEASAVTLAMEATLSQLTEMIVDQRAFETLRYNVLWLLGGPMPHRVLDDVRQNGASLNLLCNGMASRELTGGEAFWAAYRDRFDLSRNPQLPGWAGYMTRRDHQVVLLFTPGH